MYCIIYEYRENIPLEKKLIELITDRFCCTSSLRGLLESVGFRLRLIVHIPLQRKLIFEKYYNFLCQFEK